VWAFSDESERAATMLIAVVVLGPKHVSPARTVMRSRLLPGERRVHTAKESARRRRQVLDRVAQIDGLSATVIRYRRPAGVDYVAGRRALIDAAAGLIVAVGVTSWTLDDIPPSQRARDRNTIGHVLARQHVGRVVFDHRPSRGEPLLWAADAVAWAVGAGGDWKRRIDPVVTVADIGP
jgi:hypothetical protein